MKIKKMITKKKGLVLLAGGVFLLMLFLILKTVGKSQKLEEESVGGKEIKIFFDPAGGSKNPGDFFSVAVKMETVKKVFPVFGGTIGFQYDPSLVTLDPNSIVCGSDFPNNPIVVEPAAGKIEFTCFKIGEVNLQPGVAYELGRFQIQISPSAQDGQEVNLKVYKKVFPDAKGEGLDLSFSEQSPRFTIK